MSPERQPERLRVAWIVPGFQGEVGEPGIPALGILAEDLAHYCELHVYAVRFPKRTADYRVGQVAVRSFGNREDPARGALWRRARSARRWAAVLAAIAAEHRRAPFTLIHGLWASEPGMLAVVAGRLLGMPSLVSVAGGELASVRPAGYGGQLRLMERLQIALTLNLADAIGVGSVDARRRMLLRYPWLHARIRTLPLGYCPAMFGPLSAAPQPGRVVCVASWAPVKGHALLAAAVRILIDRGIPIELVLIGERTNGAEARAAVEAWGIGEHSRLVGAVPQSVVAMELHAAAVAVVASWHEAQCLAILEALACGVPVVSTPVGVARDVLRDGRVGSFVANRTPIRLAEALSTYLGLSVGGPEQHAARCAAATPYARPAVTEGFLAVYEGLKYMQSARTTGAIVVCSPYGERLR